MTVKRALLQGTRLLESAGVLAPRLTAEVLLAHAMRRDRIYLFAHSDKELGELEWLHFGRYLHERMQGKPTQYITKVQEFYGREFRVTQDVLIPRPETEHVVDVFLRVARGSRNVLDVGTGSGALAATLQLETGATVWATDISPRAAALADANGLRLGARMRVVVCDLMDAIGTATMDAIVSNPPYVPHTQKEGLQREVRDWEPHVALFGGESGFEIYERIIADAPRVLRPGGWLILELGFGTVDRVSETLKDWHDLQIEPDLAGIPRVIAARI
jgi:release factor glutamine methyltransferase